MQCTMLEISSQNAIAGAYGALQCQAVLLTPSFYSWGSWGTGLITHMRPRSLEVAVLGFEPRLLVQNKSTSVLLPILFPHNCVRLLHWSCFTSVSSPLHTLPYYSWGEGEGTATMPPWGFAHVTSGMLPTLPLPPYSDRDLQAATCSGCVLYSNPTAHFEQTGEDSDTPAG